MPGLRLLLVVDVFSPTPTAAAVQMHDLAIALGRLGSTCTVLTPDDRIEGPFTLERGDSVSVLKIRSGPLKRTNLIRRTLNEMMLSTRMWAGYRRSPVSAEAWDGVIFYSPSIFFGRFVAKLKSLHRCPAYLILRDIFPDWAADLGVMSKGPHYSLFRAFARYQYGVADRIGIESSLTRSYFDPADERVEVLENWTDTSLGQAPDHPPPNELRGRKVLVFAGNMGVAQDMDNLLRLSQRLADRQMVRILFVGTGSERARLEAETKRRRLQNVFFLDAMDRAQLRGLLRHCHIGLISLDRRLRTHNVPGKLLTYLEVGLPVLGSVNPGNEIKSMIEESGSGLVFWNGEDDALAEGARRLLKDDDARDRMAEAAARLCRARFSSVAAAKKILEFFNPSSLRAKEMVTPAC